jgi:putative Mn2+ efflux pump MntP
MQVWELILIAVSLSMDAFAIAVCKGLTLKRIKLRHCVTVGLYFGIAQAVMPLIGYLLASTVASRIADYSFYIAFVLLLVIGGNMIREAIKGEEECTDCALTFKALFPMAVATSIDALAVGVSFALLDVMIVPAVSLIGIITFLLSAIGVRIGSFVGGKFQKIASIAGGVVLIGMGTKILLEGLGVL